MFFKQYSDLCKTMKRILVASGGIGGVIKSPYFHVALVITIVSYGSWGKENWWSNVFSIIPGLIGFTFAGFAIFLTLGTDTYKRMIAGKDDDNESPYMVVSATFIRFIVVQLLALIFALVSSSVNELPAIFDQAITSILELCLWGISYLVFIYAVMLAIAAGIALFNAASWFDELETKNKQQSEDHKA